MSLTSKTHYGLFGAATTSPDGHERPFASPKQTAGDGNPIDGQPDERALRHDRQPSPVAVNTKVVG